MALVRGETSYICFDTSIARLEAVIKSGMEHGTGETYDRLAELLAIKN